MVFAFLVEYSFIKVQWIELFDSYGESTFVFETPSTENIDSILYEDEESVDSDDTINNLHDEARSDHCEQLFFVDKTNTFNSHLIIASTTAICFKREIFCTVPWQNIFVCPVL